MILTNKIIYFFLFFLMLNFCSCFFEIDNSEQKKSMMSCEGSNCIVQPLNSKESFLLNDDYFVPFKQSILRISYADSNKEKISDISINNGQVFTMIRFNENGVVSVVGSRKYHGDYYFILGQNESGQYELKNGYKPSMME